MKRIAIMAGLLLLLVTMAVVVNERVEPAQAQSGLPEIQFIGQGPGDFTSPLDDFIIKTVSPFSFSFREGPTTTLSSERRIWGVRGTNNVGSIWHETVDLGSVDAGCIVEYIGIDDDPDGRINYFQVNGETVETVTQGLVFQGSFVVPEDGSMTFTAEDSVAGWFTRCADRVDPTLTPTLVPTITLEPTATGTATPGPSPTATGTATPGPSPTATSTAVPPEPTITSTPEPSPTPTKRPREYSCVRINFEVSGHDAARGLYIVQETGGKLLASWYALDGWQDSGWFKDIDITHENVYVQVLYYRGPDTEPVELQILNHAPDSPYGWMSWGVCHALEVAWPDEKPEGAIVPDDPAPAASEEEHRTAVDPAPAVEEASAEDQPATSAVEPAVPAEPATTTDEEEQNSLAPASLNS